MLKSFKPLLQLIYPAVCLICHKAGSTICSSCTSNWQQDVKSGQISGIPLYFTNFYNAEAAKIILAAKENGNLIAQELMANSIVKSLKVAINDLSLIGDIVLIGIPSSAVSIRKRGRNHINELIVKINAIAKIYGISIINLPILQTTKKIKDQSKLNKIERMQNLSGAYLANNPERAIKNLIIIDDLITTGASTQEGIRALSEINLRPVAIITACAVGAHL